MRFVQYEHVDGRRGLGIQLNNCDQIVGLNDADPTIPADMVSFLHCQYPIEKIEKYVRRQRSCQNEVHY